MAKKEQHRDRSGCPLACALDIIGDRWTLLIIRDLMFLGRHEYKDMLMAEEGISSNILSDRLKKLFESGLVAEMAHPDSRRRKLYYLTTKGKGLIHVMIQIILWSDRSLGDIVKIPPEKKERLRTAPETIIEETLKALKTWEGQYGLMK